jgi:hypothetical protein
MGASTLTSINLVKNAHESGGPQGEVKPDPIDPASLTDEASIATWPAVPAV